MASTKPPADTAKPDTGRKKHEFKKKLKASSFLKIFTLQAGTCVICSIGVAIMIGLVFYNSTEKDYLDADYRTCQYSLMYTYASLMFFGLVFVSFASFMLKPTLLKIGTLLVLTAFLFWLVISVLSFVQNGTQLFRYVCIDARCPPTHWLFDSGWRDYGYFCTFDDSEVGTVFIYDELDSTNNKTRDNNTVPIGSNQRLANSRQYLNSSEVPSVAKINDTDSNVKEYENEDLPCCPEPLEVPRKLRDLGCHVNSVPRLFATALFFTVYTLFMAYGIYIFYMQIKEMKEEEELPVELGSQGGPPATGPPPPARPPPRPSPAPAPPARPPPRPSPAPAPPDRPSGGPSISSPPQA